MHLSCLTIIDYLSIIVDNKLNVENIDMANSKELARKMVSLCIISKLGNVCTLCDDVFDYINNLNELKAINEEVTPEQCRKNIKRTDRVAEKTKQLKRQAERDEKENRNTQHW